MRSAFSAGSINSDGETICYNANPIAIGSYSDASGGDEGSITYQWQKSTFNGSSWSSWGDESGATSSSFDPSNLTTTTKYRRRAQDGACSGGSGGWVESTGEWIVTVNPAISYNMTDNAGNSAPYVKAGSAVNFTITTTGGTLRSADASQINIEANARYVYTWNTIPSGGSTPIFQNETIASGTTTATFAIATSTQSDNGTYSVVVRDANACTSSDGSASTVVMVYPTTNLYVNNTTDGSDVTGTGWPTSPLASITKAVDVASSVASDGHTINVMSTGTAYSDGTSGPVINKPLVIKHVAATSPYGSLSSDVSFTSGQHFIIGHGRNTTDSITFSGFIPVSVYVNTDGDIQNAINAVNSTTGIVKLLAGTYGSTNLNADGSLTIVNGITVQGPSISDASTTCDMVPTATIANTTASAKLFKTYGATAKTIKNMILEVGTSGRFIEIVSGSSGNVSTELMQFKYNPSGTSTRLFGVTNADNSVGVLNDVAKFINDINDVSFGTGRVIYGAQAPLPWSSLEIGWKAEDSKVNTAGARVMEMYPMKGTTRIQNVGTTTTRPTFALATGGDAINGRAALMFQINESRFLHASTTAGVNGGTDKTVFVVFNTGDDLASNASDMVIYKHGNHESGISMVMLPDGGQDDFELNIYNTSGGTTVRASLDVANLAATTTYIAQVYFDDAGGVVANSDGTYRVGMALDNNSTQLGAANSDGSAFSVTTLATPTIGTASNISVGARSGSVHFDGTNQTAAGQGHYFNGKVAEIIILNTAAAATRDAVYCYLRNKYMSTQSVDNELAKPGDGDVVAGERSFEPNISVYPNPVDDELTTEVVIRVGGKIRVTLRDAIGREIQTVFEGVVGDETVLPLTTDVRNLPTGAYMMHVSGADELNMVVPFMIRH